MPIAYRHRDESNELAHTVNGLEIHREMNAGVMAEIQQRSIADIQTRFDNGHRAYLATVRGVPAAWGWVATQFANIGELQTTFSIAHDQRYLWNFVTLPPFRGRSIYPLLVNAIVSAESRDATGFWIAYAPENHASGAGIRKAGFTLVAELSFDNAGHPVVKDIRPDGGKEASRLLGLPDTGMAIAQCWKCVRGPAPSMKACTTRVCSCDYQRPEKVCATV